MRRLFVILGIVVLLVGGWAVWLMNAAGEFRTLAPHFDGTCTPVPGVVGSEDITINPRTGFAYLSATDRFAVRDGKPPNGVIWGYDLSQPAPKPVNLTPDAGPAFAPHGISLHIAADGTGTLFVINHAGGRNTIETYDVAPDRLVHRQTLSDPLLVSPNDLLAVTPTQVYVTNDHGHPKGFMRVVEDYLRRPWSNVVMWDGAKFREIAGGIRLANGINLGHEGKTVYVASVIGQSVRVYDRDPASGALTFRIEIPLGTGPDNIETDADGSLWIAAHPKLLTVVRYMDGAIPHAPTQILHAVERGGRWDVEEVYLNLGDQIAGASVGAVRGKRLLIGAIADSKVLDCQMR